MAVRQAAQNSQTASAQFGTSPSESCGHSRLVPPPTKKGGLSYCFPSLTKEGAPSTKDTPMFPLTVLFSRCHRLPDLHDVG